MSALELDFAELIDSLVQVLETTGYQVGRGKAPKELTDPKMPYLVLFLSPGDYDGTLGDTAATSCIEFQVKGIAPSHDGALISANAARRVLVNTVLDLSTGSAQPIQPDQRRINPYPERNDPTTPVLFLCPIYYQIRIT